MKLKTINILAIFLIGSLSLSGQRDLESVISEAQKPNPDILYLANELQNVIDASSKREEKDRALDALINLYMKNMDSNAGRILIPIENRISSVDNPFERCRLLVLRGESLEILSLKENSNQLRSEAMAAYLEAYEVMLSYDISNFDYESEQKMIVELSSKKNDEVISMEEYLSAVKIFKEKTNLSPFLNQLVNKIKEMKLSQDELMIVKHSFPKLEEELTQPKKSD